MSADYETKHYEAYAHPDYLAVFMRGEEDGLFGGGQYFLGGFTEKDFEELAEIARLWKASRMRGGGKGHGSRPAQPPAG